MSLFINQTRLESSQHRQQGRTCRGHVWPAPVGQGRPELASTADREGDNGTDPALAVSRTRCSCTGTFPGTAPLEPPRDSGTSRQQAELGRRRHRGAAAKCAGEAPAPRGRWARRRQRSGNFHRGCSPSWRRGREGGGAAAGAIPRAAARRARAGISPAPVRAAQPPPPGPALTAALVGHWVSGGSCYCRLNENCRQV